MQPVALVARLFAPLLETQPPPEPDRFAKLRRERSAQQWSFRSLRWSASKYWWPPKAPCTMQWHSLQAIPAGESGPMATYALHVHDGNLFAGGIGGVICWDPDEQAWQTLNAGFGEPAWLGSPMVVSLASYNDGLYAVMANGAGPRLYRLPDSSVVWEAQWDAPDGARSLLADSGMLYLGTTTGVYAYAKAEEGWYPIGQELPSTVSTIVRVDTDLLAGTFAGDVIRYNPVTLFWEFATTPLSSTHIFAIEEYGQYLYVGGNKGFSRCWTESGAWDDLSPCEPIEPETGFPADLVALGFHVHKAQLYVATPQGIQQFDAANDQWSPLNTGLVDAAGIPLHAFNLTTLDDQLVVGTLDGVRQYGCW